MTEDKLWQVYAYATAIWPSFKIPIDEAERKIFYQVWLDELKPYPLKVIQIAMNEHARNSDFANLLKISDLCEKYLQIDNGTYVSDEAILKEIRQAIQAFSKNEIFEKLSPMAKEIVGTPAQLYKWGMCETGTIDTVAMSNVRKSLESLKEAKRSEKSVKQIRLLMSANKLIEG